MSDTGRKRATLFAAPIKTDDEPMKKELNLERFTPKAAPVIDPAVLEKINEESGFTTKHAESKVAKKRDGRTLKKSPRTTQFNVRLKPDTANKFWKGAEDESIEYADDFLSLLLKLYEKHSN